MAEGIFRPIPLEYGGLYADDSLLDAQQLGISLVGLSRVTNSLVHFWLMGQITKDPRLYQVRVFVGPPKRGSLIYEILALMATGSLPLYAPLLCELAERFLPSLFGAVVQTRVGRKDQADKMIDQIADMAQRHDAFARDVHQGHLRDKAWLQDHVTQLTALLTPALQKLPDPVGQTCRTLKFGRRTKLTDPVVIDEPTAEVLKSQEEMEVGDMTTMRAKLRGVDTTNGVCKVQIEGSEETLRGKITDPALNVAQNVYTHALDTQQDIELVAKPVLKNGSIVSLYISDAKLA